MVAWQLTCRLDGPLECTHQAAKTSSEQHRPGCSTRFPPTTACTESCAGTPDEGWTAVSLPSGRYQISNGLGLCLGVLGGSTAQGAAVVQWGCNGSPDQQWIPGGATAADSDFSYQLVNANSRLCLGILGASASQGAVSVQWPCNSSPDQPAHPVTFMNGVDTISDVKAEAAKAAWTKRDAVPGAG